MAGVRALHPQPRQVGKPLLQPLQAPAGGTSPVCQVMKLHPSPQACTGSYSSLLFHCIIPQYSNDHELDRQMDRLI